MTFENPSSYENQVQRLLQTSIYLFKPCSIRWILVQDNYPPLMDIEAKVEVNSVASVMEPAFESGNEPKYIPSFIPKIIFARDWNHG